MENTIKKFNIEKMENRKEFTFYFPYSYFGGCSNWSSYYTNHNSSHNHHITTSNSSDCSTYNPVDACGKNDALQQTGKFTHTIKDQINPANNSVHANITNTVCHDNGLINTTTTTHANHNGHVNNSTHNSGNLNHGHVNNSTHNTGNMNSGHINNSTHNTGNVNSGHVNNSTHNTNNVNHGHVNNSTHNTNNVNHGHVNNSTHNSGNLNHAHVNNSTHNTNNVNHEQVNCPTNVTNVNHNHSNHLTHNNGKHLVSLNTNSATYIPNTSNSVICIDGVTINPNTVHTPASHITVTGEGNIIKPVGKEFVNAWFQNAHQSSVTSVFTSTSQFYSGNHGDGVLASCCSSTSNPNVYTSANLTLADHNNCSITNASIKIKGGVHGSSTHQAMLSVNGNHYDVTCAKNGTIKIAKGKILKWWKS